MTEYNYSDDAYERYLATQQRIARWTDETSRYHPSDPFIASPMEGSRSSIWSSSQSSSSRSPGSSGAAAQCSQTRHPSTSNTTIHHKPEPSRSETVSTSGRKSSAGHSHTSTLSRHNHHRSRTTHTKRSSGSHVTTSTVKTVIPNTDSPTYTKGSNSQPVHIPIVRRYLIIPPKSTRLEVLVSTYLLLLSLLAWWVTFEAGIHVDQGT